MHRHCSSTFAYRGKLQTTTMISLTSQTIRLNQSKFVAGSRSRQGKKYLPRGSSVACCRARTSNIRRICHSRRVCAAHLTISFCLLNFSWAGVARIQARAFKAPARAQAGQTDIQ